MTQGIAPPWLLTMREITGTLESPGSADNPTIMAWCDEIARRYPEMRSYCDLYQHDATPWCGLAMAYCMAKNGIRPVFGPDDTDKFLWANAWTQFGKKLSTPQLGAIMVFRREGGGHVALYEDENDFDNTYEVRGGNQSDSVSVTTMPKSSLVGIVWPAHAIETTQPFGQVRSGRGSWYSQYEGIHSWRDSMDQPNSNALGVDDRYQGIALRERATLGKWFVVRAPNNKDSIEQHTDIGPGERTGRDIDISAAAAERMGYSPNTFPTDSIFRWLPTNPPAAVAHLTPREQARVYADMRGEEMAVSLEQPATQGKVAGPDVGSIVNALLPLVLEVIKRRRPDLFEPPLTMPPIIPPAPAPTPPVPVAPTESASSFDLRTGILGILGSLLASFMGVMGTPVGETATTTGAVTPLIVAAGAALGIPSWITSIFGAWARRRFQK